MRLDHISYASSHDQLADVLQRLGAQIGSPFTDGGIHPRFGTRNFVLPLKNGQYIEVVCPLNHPAADASPFGRAVSQRANEGGGWLAWVVSTEDISPFEQRIGRKAVQGHRTKPNGEDLQWKQIGVLDTLNDAQLPFFIEWISGTHPSFNEICSAEISAIEIAGTKQILKDWLGVDYNFFLGGIELQWIDKEKNDGINGIVSITLKTHLGEIRLT